MQPTVATSIAPRNLEIQKIAIDSWLELGFSVTSLNIQEEVDYLSPFFKGVKFLTLNRSGRNLYGKNYAYISDIIYYLNFSENNLCGIINSDIIMRIDSSLLKLLEFEYRDSLLFASRRDLNCLSDQEGTIFDVGFDVFFFDRKLLSAFPSSKFCLGVPWWDYWFPWVALQNGFSVKYVATPIAYHLKHEANYDHHLWNRVGMKFLRQYDKTLYEALLAAARNTPLPQIKSILSSVLDQSARRFLAEIQQTSYKIW
jgi:hypothetical protein